MNKKINKQICIAFSRMASVVMIFALLSTNVNAQNTVTIGTGTSDHYYYGPYYRSSSGSSFNYSNYVYLYTSSELNIPPGAIITKVEWYKKSGTITGGNNVFKLWMENTTTSSISTSGNLGNYLSSATSVYSSNTKNFTVTNGWEAITLSAPFEYTGNNLFIITGHEKYGTASGANRWRYHNAPGKAEGTAGSSPRTNSSTFSSTYDDKRPNIRITWEPGCPVEFTAGPTNTATCAADSAIFTANVDSAQTYQWQVNDGNGWANLQNSNNYSGTASKDLVVKNTTMNMQDYYYRLIATNTNEACSIESDSAKLTIKPTSPSTIVINADKGNSVCKGEEVTFVSYFSKAGINPTYQWYNNGNAIAGAENPTYKTDQLADDDSVYCIMNSSIECVLSDVSNGVKMSVNPLLKPEVGLYIVDNGDGSFTFNAVPTNGGANPTYEWYKNSSKISGANSASLQLTDVASFDRIHVDMYSSEECLESPVATSSEMATSVDELNNDLFTGLKVYPNPNSGQFVISGILNDGAATKDVSITVTSSLGQTVYQKEIQANGNFEVSVDVKDLAANGLYLLSLSVDGKVTSKRFMINK